MLAEIRALRERYPGFRLLAPEHGLPIFEGTLQVDGRDHLVRLCLPPAYPRVPPELHEYDLQSRHERPRGPGRLAQGLCLFPHGNDDQAWRPQRLAVEALDRFPEFIRQERATRRDTLPAQQQLHLPASIRNVLVDLGHATLVVRQARVPGELQVVGVEFEHAPSLGFSHATSNAFLQFLPHESRIPTLVISAMDPWPSLVGSLDRLEHTLRREVGDRRFESLRASPTLVLARRHHAGQVDLACVHRPPGQIGTLFLVPIVDEDLEAQLFRRVDGVIEGREQLALQRVIMIGVGSLGGAIAVALARAGVGRFLLIDPETLALENVSRHVGTLHALERPKVEVVRDTIRAINPACVVDVITKPLAWDLPQWSAGLDLERALAEPTPSLLVCTCAEALVERQLNELAQRTRTTAIYAAALGACEHGRIIRVRPGQSPCLECILRAQDRDPSRYPRFIAAGARDGQPRYLQPGLPGLAIDITILAMLTARFALQTIADLHAIELGIPTEPGDHLLWTARGGWIFDRPQQQIVEHFPRAADCPVCQGQGDELDDSATLELDTLVAQLRG